MACFRTNFAYTLRRCIEMLVLHLANIPYVGVESASHIPFPAVRAAICQRQLMKQQLRFFSSSL
jgi:hypothetical protein